jgi:hypothetical protein
MIPSDGSRSFAFNTAGIKAQSGNAFCDLGFRLNSQPISGNLLALDRGTHSGPLAGLVSYPVCHRRLLPRC